MFLETIRVTVTRQNIVTDCFGEGMGLSIRLVKFIKAMKPGFCGLFSEHV
jgi:hypothetical protein